MLRFFDSTKAPSVLMAGLPVMISCCQVSLSLASHCSFCEGSGKCQGVPMVGQPAVVFTDITFVMRSHRHEVLFERVSTAPFTVEHSTLDGDLPSPGLGKDPILPCQAGHFLLVFAKLAVA